MGGGRCRSTAHRWLRQQAFRDELARQRDAVFSEALDAVKTHATRAMAELARLLCSKDDRLRRFICNDILGHALRVRELDDIARRLAALEKAVGGGRRAVINKGGKVKTEDTRLKKLERQAPPIERQFIS